MHTPTETYANELQAQHTIQSNDLLQICRLAKVENVFDKIKSFSFEQFFGFACHLFITTDSQHSREQLAAILPKFGSIAVFSLLKILHHLNSSENSLEREQQLVRLSMESLKMMPVPTLVIGIAQLLEKGEKAGSDLADAFEMIAPALVTLTAHHGENILLLLSQKLSESTWNALQQQLVQTLTTLRAQRSLNNSTHPVKLKVKRAELQLAEIAC